MLKKLEEVAGVIEKYPSDIPPATKTMSEELNSNYIIAHAEFKVTVSEMKQYDDSEAKEYRAKAKEASAGVGKLYKQVQTFTKESKKKATSERATAAVAEGSK